MSKTAILHVQGMTCSICDRVISFALRQLPGVRSVKSSYLRSSVNVTYDPDRCSRDAIEHALEQVGYPALEKAPRVPAVLLMFGAAVLLFSLMQVAPLPAAPRAEAGASLVALFVIGLVTSVHCVAMCGGIMLTQTVEGLDRVSRRAYNSPGNPGIRWGDIRPAFLYNGGRLLSYVLAGALIGGLGGVLAYGPSARGALLVAVGILVVLFGLRMLGIAPAFPATFSQRLPAALLRSPLRRMLASRKSLIVGLATGLMPCGALASMWLCAASSGSAGAGAAAMAAFALGTMPLMVLFGAVGPLLPGTWMKRLLSISAVVMLALGLNLAFAGVSSLLVL